MFQQKSEGVYSRHFSTCWLLLVLPVMFLSREGLGKLIYLLKLFRMVSGPKNFNIVHDISHYIGDTESGKFHWIANSGKVVLGFQKLLSDHSRIRVSYVRNWIFCWMLNNISKRKCD